MALVDVGVIDGTGAAPLLHQTVLIRQGRVTEVYPVHERRDLKGVEIMRLPGHFVIPGLIDAHVHATLPFTTRALQDDVLGRMFRGGITTVRDMAGDAIVLAERAAESSDAASPYPRIFYSALVAGPTWISVDDRVAPIAHGRRPGEAPWLRAVTDTSDIRQLIIEARATGATGIKLYADIPPQLVRSLTAEAHRAGLKVWAHAAIIPTRPSEAVAAGVDVMSHVMSIVLEGMDSMPQREGASARFHDYLAVPVSAPSIARLLTLMVERGTVLEPTLHVTQRRSTRAAASGDSLQRRWISLEDWGFEFTRRAHALGVPILAGTDRMLDTAMSPLPLLHEELELLVRKAGLTSLAAITAATATGAKVLGAADSLGTVTAGKVADLVVLTANPAIDIKNTRTVRYVIKGGRVYPVAKP